MKIEKLQSGKKILAQLFLLVLPACLIGAYMLWHINQYFSVLNNEWFAQTIYLSAGLISACFLYNHRFRFVTTFLILLLLLSITGKLINNIFTGEFTAFYASTRFYIFTILFILGWLAGWGFARLRFFPIVLSSLLLLIQITVVGKTTDITAQKLLIAFAPVLLFALYIIYTAELIRNMNEDEPSFGWFIGKKLAGFAVISGLLLLLLLIFFDKEFKAIEKEYGGAGKQEKEENKESATNKNKDGTRSNKKDMGLTGGRKTTKELVFIAKLENYLPGTETPNPLYFTYDYFTKFDTLTQTLETDSLMPSNDLFQPDPSKIPLYFTEADSSVMVKSKGTLKRRILTTEVYKALLSPKDFLAPSTAFFCQPIAIDKEYQQQFKSAYRAKMYVSDLNSAYFIYNPSGNEALENFQQERFSELRKVSNWDGEDAAFMKYYTFIPRGEDFDSIRALASFLTESSPAPIDKIIAIRDYFLSNDENGQPLYKYTDNPGIPGLPSASKLNYFLFENRKGYCAYFAGATLFLLRALGMPTRVATGFLTVDRSDKNIGWYWFYEDQAHAWVQVYFPGYGWIDFDTTIPSTETQQSPAPDGTPPITVQTAWFVGNGKIESIDTAAKKMTLGVKKLIYHDKVFDLKIPISVKMDLSIATINRDTGSVPISTLVKGMEVTALSFSEIIKNLPPQPNEDMDALLAKVPKPAPIDEVRILDTEKEKKEAKKEKKQKPPVSLWKILWISLAALGGIVLIILMLPWLIYRYFRYKAGHTSNPSGKAYYNYTAAMYLLNQLGYSRGNMSPLQFARNVADDTFKTDFATFIQVYLKSKYSTEPLNEWEQKIVNMFYPPFEKAVNRKISFGKRFNKFINFYRTINFFTKPKS